ncbi:MAG TPA: hypothetical protein VJ652_09695 [Noviherbaspirillum sp.]|nr:hypothetical protein [Noviherbaspirillum sp.]
MKSTFHEVELGKAVVQNAIEGGTEQLVVTLPPENRSSIQIQIRQNKDGNSSTSNTIEISQHGLQQLFDWLKEEDALP